MEYGNVARAGRRKSAVLNRIDACTPGKNATRFEGKRDARGNVEVRG
jgi:hypothetical protein